jgi:hypothetical protein
LDGVLIDAPTNQSHGIRRAPIERTRTLRAELPQQRVLAAREATEHETAIAPRGAMPDLVRFKQHDITHPPLRQAQRRVQAGKAAADYAHLGLDRSNQRTAGAHSVTVAR